MARFCQITKRKTIVGNSRSHAMNSVKRKFYLNLKVRKFWISSQNRFLKLKVSVKGMRLIEKNGIEKFLEKGFNQK